MISAILKRWRGWIAALSSAAIICILIIAGCGGGSTDSISYRSDSGQTAAGTGSITGTVKGPAEKAIGDVEVCCYGSAAKGKEQTLLGSTKTDEKGFFTLSGIPEGTQRIVLSHASHKTATLTTEVKSGATTTAASEGISYVRLHTNLATVKKKAWTVMIYFAAANDLYQGDFTSNYQQLSSVNVSSDVNLVAFVASPSQTSKIYLFSPQTSEGPVIYYDYGQSLNAGQNDTLTNFATTAMEAFPSDHYMLICWDHGAGIYDDGWFSESAGSPRAFCFQEDNSGNYTGCLLTRDIPTIVSTITQSTGANIDVVGFDCCMMGMFEVAYEFKNTGVSYVTFSELEIPGGGYPYNYPWLANLNGSTTPQTLVTNLVNDYYSSYLGNGTASLAALNVQKFSQPGSTIDLYNQLAEELYNIDSTDLETVKTTVVQNTQSMVYPAHPAGWEKCWNSYRDLKDFCYQLIQATLTSPNASALKTVAQDLYDNLETGPDNVIVNAKACSYESPKISAGNLFGISTLIFDPRYEWYQDWVSNGYQQLDYYTDGNTYWGQFLKRMRNN